jgi:hypothetical protein
MLVKIRLFFTFSLLTDGLYSMLLQKSLPFFFLAFLIAGCQSQGEQANQQPCQEQELTNTQTQKAVVDQAIPAKVELSLDEQIDQRVKALILQAWQAESDISPILQGMEKELKIELAGFEHRLKTYGSTTRKLKKLKHEDDALVLSTAQTGDVLRYTFLIKDSPAKNYVTQAKQVLSTLEQKGNLVKQVKNYWPKGDNYSGLNCVLDKDGLIWELQIHTPESYEASKKDRALYEKMREISTPLEEKQALFDQMTQPWEKIKIPADILNEKSVHAIQENIKKDRPKK